MASSINLLLGLERTWLKSYRRGVFFKECAGVIDVRSHPRITIGMLRMVSLARRQNDRVNLNCIHVRSPVPQRCGYIIPAGSHA
ncbi:MAG TPA: hypothetical protein VNK82_03175 [Terriglobales bacterium]|nr:hypothetical protein [Terriglobales bacterium]